MPLEDKENKSDVKDDDVKKQVADDSGDNGNNNEDDDKKSDQDDTQQPTIEEVAMKIGWNPNYKGKNSISAEQFILNSKDINASMLKKVNSMTSEMEEMRRSVEMLAEYSKKGAESKVADIKSRIEQLKAERIQAVANADTQAFETIDKQIMQLNKMVVETGDIKQPNNNAIAYKKWIDDNMWYERDNDMRRWADTYYDKTMDPAIKARSYGDILKHIASKAKEIFPEKFDDNDDNGVAASPNVAKGKVKRVPQVATPSINPNHKKKSYTFNDLTHHQKKIAEEMVGMFQGTKNEMTLDEYADKLLKKYENK